MGMTGNGVEDHAGPGAHLGSALPAAPVTGPLLADSTRIGLGLGLGLGLFVVVSATGTADISIGTGVVVSSTTASSTSTGVSGSSAKSVLPRTGATPIIGTKPATVVLVPVVVLDELTVASVRNLWGDHRTLRGLTSNR